ncbi:hypothetical protein T10_11554 [Trichinella papuae]|uniref:Uncharacterized protein n=1 Tax=Trichinella papuae TaxID=268474 RepID=A0A0V1MQ06_9BILA|nr:hypothetical protein T10_11554 [Trichinella papuae]
MTMNEKQHEQKLTLHRKDTFARQGILKTVETYFGLTTIIKAFHGTVDDEMSATILTAILIAFNYSSSDT